MQPVLPGTVDANQGGVLAAPLVSGGRWSEALMEQRCALTFAGRVGISSGRKAGWGIRQIARHVGRAPSVVSREVTRNSYLHAGCQAERSRARRKVLKIVGDPVLSARVPADLKLGRSPRAIAGRLDAELADASDPERAGVAQVRS